MRRYLYIFTALVLTLSGCSKSFDKTTGYNNVVFVCSLGYNNLSETLNNNIDEMCTGGGVPDLKSGNVLLVFNHSTWSDRNYFTHTQPCLYRIYNNNGTVVRDTLKEYSRDIISASAGTLRSVLEYVKEEFPSRSYGMLFSSHGTGWLPEGYDMNPEDGDEEVWGSDSTPALSPKDVQSAGMHVIAGRKEVSYYGIDMDDLPGCFPMHFDYVVFDACLMGCAEVAYQLRDVCSQLVFSPTEVLEKGFSYKTILSRLYAKDLAGVAKDYYDKYKSGAYASVSVVDCSKMEKLASVCAGIVSAHRTAISTIDKSKVQKYFYNDKHWFYDLRDIFANAEASGSEMEALDSALEECVTYKVWTESFFNLKLERVCGLSMYIPLSNCPELNAFYKSLDWNKAIGLVK